MNEENKKNKKKYVQLWPATYSLKHTGPSPTFGAEF